MTLVLCAFCLDSARAQPQTVSVGGVEIPVAEAQLLRDVDAMAEADPAGAVALLESAVGPESSVLLLDTLGVMRRRLGRVQAAVEAFESALERDGGFLRSRENLAKVLLQMERDGDARAELERVLAAAPGRHWARSALVELLLRADEYDASIPHLLFLLDVDATARSATGDGDDDQGGALPGKAELWRLLAHVRLEQGWTQAAEDACSQALVMSPEDPQLRLLLIQCMVAGGEVDRALPLVEQELGYRPLQLELWRLLAASRYGDGDVEGALLAFETARRLGVAEPRDLADLADLYLAQGLRENAMGCYRESLGGQGLAPERLLKAAGNLAALGLWDGTSELLASLEAGALDDDQRQEVDRLQAEVARARGDLNTARTLIERALERAPLDAELLLELGDLNRLEGELTEALVLYERAARVGDAFRQRALVRQAQVYVERGEYDKAVSCLRDALKHGDEPYIERYLAQVQRMLVP
jgi:tetratricopeptide (TPR) repeat protein